MFEIMGFFTVVPDAKNLLIGVVSGYVVEKICVHRKYCMLILRSLERAL